jgi:5-methylthioadenosine/S-adenosylhomocysteine deaminase
MLRICSFFFAASLCTASVAAEPPDWIWSARYVITGVGTQSEIDARFEAAHRLDRNDSILSPGLSDTHTHAAMSLFRGIADDKKLQDWLENYRFCKKPRSIAPRSAPRSSRAGSRSYSLARWTALFAQPSGVRTCT